MNLKLSTMMKRKLFLPAFVVLALTGTRCGDDDEKPKTIPTVTTHAATDVQTNSATLHGEIVEDGNADITATGFVYSSVVSEPTLADDKVELTDTEDDFSSTVSGLSSGTTYHVRAYATNSKGTAYGEVVDVPTGNAAPTVTNVNITGDAEVNKTLTVAFTYNDAEGDAQGETTIVWYAANEATFASSTVIAGATENAYTIAEPYQGKYIRAGVTPKAVTGNMNGSEVKSNPVGAVGEATTVTFPYNNHSVTYGIIISTTTGRKWLDRNLGAPNTPSSEDDWANFGDLFQYGRLADGHQIINRNGPTDAEMSGKNGTTNSDWTGGGVVEYSTTDVPGHSKFIVLDGLAPADWRKPQNDNLWQGVNGINNPCPTGWRIPTKAEWVAENLTTITDGYSKLKLTKTSVRSFDNRFFQSASSGNYWSTTIEGDPTGIVRMRLYTTNVIVAQSRGNGMACRCIKD